VPQRSVGTVVAGDVFVRETPEHALSTTLAATRTILTDLTSRIHHAAASGSTFLELVSQASGLSKVGRGRGRDPSRGLGSVFLAVDGSRAARRLEK
jgi:hypothetical protein